MIIVWSRWGILVPLIVVVCLFGAAFCIAPFHLETKLASSLLWIAGSAISALAIFFLARSLEAKKPRVLLDQATNKRVALRANAGHFFFVPMRWWPYVIAAIGALLATLELTGQFPRAR